MDKNISDILIQLKKELKEGKQKAELDNSRVAVILAWFVKRDKLPQRGKRNFILGPSGKVSCLESETEGTQAFVFNQHYDRYTGEFIELRARVGCYRIKIDKHNAIGDLEDDSFRAKYADMGDIDDPHNIGDDPLGELFLAAYSNRNYEALAEAINIRKAEDIGLLLLLKKVLLELEEHGHEAQN